MYRLTLNAFATLCVPATSCCSRVSRCFSPVTKGDDDFGCTVVECQVAFFDTSVHGGSVMLEAQHANRRMDITDTDAAINQTRLEEGPGRVVDGDGAGSWAQLITTRDACERFTHSVAAPILAVRVSLRGLLWRLQGNPGIP